jgi:hypothetical protein
MEKLALSLACGIYDRNFTIFAGAGRLVDQPTRESIRHPLAGLVALAQRMQAGRA